MRRLEEDAEPFGPAAVLLIGFPSPTEVEAFRSMMLEMEADMFKILPCTRAMLDGTLQQALEADCPAWQAPPLGVRRVIVLSGMWGGEIAEVIAAYKASGGAPAVFAAAVPNNMSRVVRELVDDVTAEDAAMKRAAAEEDLEA